jgi:hypothetical protein
MQSYLVETYIANGDLRRWPSWERRARSAAEQLTTRGTDVRFIRSLHMPEDEISFFVFDAPSRRDAALVAEQAGLEPLRVVAVSDGLDTAKPPERERT